MQKVHFEEFSNSSEIEAVRSSAGPAGARADLRGGRCVNQGGRLRLVDERYVEDCVLGSSEKEKLVYFVEIERLLVVFVMLL
jgi:hypothetical protein